MRAILEVSLKRQMWHVLLASLALTVILLAVHPQRPPWYRILESGQFDISPAKAATLAAGSNGVLWIDSRSAPEYMEGHPVGALRLSQDQWAELAGPLFQAIKGRPPGQPIIVFDDGTGQRSAGVADKLRFEWGEEPVFLLRGDWKEL